MDVEIEYMPYELKPFPAKRYGADSDYVITSYQNDIVPMAEKLGVDITLPNFSPFPYTYTAHEGNIFAKEYGKGLEYAEAVLKAFWKDGKDIGQIDILASIAEQIGLNKGEFTQALQDHRYQSKQKEALEVALEEGIHAVPAILIGDELLEGIHTSEDIISVIQQEHKEINVGKQCSIDGCK